MGWGGAKTSCRIDVGVCCTRGARSRRWCRWCGGMGRWRGAGGRGELKQRMDGSRKTMR